MCDKEARTTIGLEAGRRLDRAYQEEKGPEVDPKWKERQQAVENFRREIFYRIRQLGKQISECNQILELLETGSAPQAVEILESLRKIY